MVNWDYIDEEVPQSPVEPVSPPRCEEPEASDVQNFTEILLEEKDASFVLGRGGKTKAKLARVSGARIQLLNVGDGTEVIRIYGSPESQERAGVYIQLVQQQRSGKIDFDLDPSAREDLTIMEIPVSCIGYITGKRGSCLRCIESEWGVLMIFAKSDEPDPGRTVQKLAVFGPLRSRLGAELKIMSVVEQKLRGYYTQNYEDVDTSRELSLEFSSYQPLGVAVFPIKSEDFSYALGRQGGTRLRLRRGADCIIEYVGNLCYVAGTADERQRARDYYDFLLQERDIENHIDVSNRDDVHVLHNLQAGAVERLIRDREGGLRSIEAVTNTFICVQKKNQKGDKNLLIFSHSDENRSRAVEICTNPGRYQGELQRPFPELMENEMMTQEERRRRRDDSGDYDAYTSHYRGRPRGDGRNDCNTQRGDVRWGPTRYEDRMLDDNRRREGRDCNNAYGRGDDRRPNGRPGGYGDPRGSHQRSSSGLYRFSQQRRVEEGDRRRGRFPD